MLKFCRTGGETKEQGWREKRFGVLREEIWSTERRNSGYRQKKFRVREKKFWVPRKKIAICACMCAYLVHYGFDRKSIHITITQWYTWNSLCMSSSPVALNQSRSWRVLDGQENGALSKESRGFLGEWDGYSALEYQLLQGWQPMYDGLSHGGGPLPMFPTMNQIQS